MAAVATATDKVADSLQNLSLDAKTKSHDVKEATKKPSVTQNGMAGNGEVISMPVLSYDRSITPGIPEYMDPNVCYVPSGYAPPGCYYGAYDGAINDWENFGQYLSPDGVEMSPHGLYGDAYNHGYGYAPYGAYPLSSPVPTVAHDGQVYGHHHYQYQGTYYPPPTPASSAHMPTQPAISDRKITTSAAADKPPPFVDIAKPNSNGIANSNGKNESVPAKMSQKNSTLASNGTSGKPTFPSSLPSGYQDPRFGSPVPWLDASGLPDWQYRPSNTSPVPPGVSHISNISTARNQNLHSHSNVLGQYPPGPPGSGFINRMYPNNRMYSPCSNALRTGRGYLANGFDLRANTHSWFPMDNKYRTRGRGNGFCGYGNENMEGLNELNRGPRSGRVKNNQKTLGPNVGAAVKGQAATSDVSSDVPERDQYNLPEFPEKYSNAKFYIIKSYSEDDVHKSVKYGVWASTPNGNKKLDAGFQEGQEKPGECPVFLFFSVNTSGQFVGVAEMVGPVDFNKTVDYWQQDKWNGCFPVKWHIVKDVPNSFLKHITLENNDNKPVTNSRDTQEVKFEQGLEMLKLFKEHVSKTSILDDFAFYETRQKIMQDKRAKQQFQKQVWYGKAAGAVVEEKDVANNKSRIQKPLEVTLILNKENSSGRLSDQNDAVKGSVDASKMVKDVPEKRILANGISNGVANGIANGVPKVVANGC